jgi:hypothetical protein
MSGGSMRRVRLKDPNGAPMTPVLLYVKSKHPDGRPRDVRVCYDEEQIDIRKLSAGGSTPEFLTVWMDEKRQRPNPAAAKASLEATHAKLNAQVDLFEKAKLEVEAGLAINRESLGSIAQHIAEKETLVEGLQFVIVLSDPKADYVVSGSNVSDRLTASMLKMVLGGAEDRTKAEDPK